MRRRVLVDMKQFAARALGKRPPPTAPTSRPSRADAEAGPASGIRRRRLVGWDLEEAREARELVTLLGRSGRPIILGPWLSETGFELLYWIPFLAWAKTYGELAAEQLVVVSRGGAAPWYLHITSQLRGRLSFYTPDEFRAANEERIIAQRGRLKHMEVSAFDQEIIARVKQERGLRDAVLLHPSRDVPAVRGLLVPARADHARRVVHGVHEDSAARAMDARHGCRSDTSPRSSTATRPCPTLPRTVRSSRRILAELTQHVDVVLLNTGQRFDDHEDLPAQARKRIQRWIT